MDDNGLEWMVVWCGVVGARKDEFGVESIGTTSDNLRRCAVRFSCCGGSRRSSMVLEPVSADVDESVANPALAPSKYSWNSNVMITLTKQRT